MGDSIITWGLELAEETENSMREIGSELTKQQQQQQPAPEYDQAALDDARRLGEQARASEAQRQLEQSKEMEYERER
jgi:hypothetical protein